MSGCGLSVGNCEHWSGNEIIIWVVNRNYATLPLPRIMTSDEVRGRGQFRHSFSFYCFTDLFLLNSTDDRH